MKFGRIPTAEGVGAILGAPLSVLGKKWKKGRELTRYDIEVLLSQNFDSIVVARMEGSDISEDAAAEAIARVICGDGLEVRSAATGRCNLYAKHRGLLQLRSDRIHAINSVDEAFTIATLPNYSTVYAGRLVVSVKIIPYAVDRALLNECITEASFGVPPINVFKFQSLSIGLIQTQTDWFAQKLLDKGKSMLESRAELVESEITEYDVCEHHEDEVSKLIVEYGKKNLDLILLLGASAIQDREDVIPKAIVNAGGRIEHLGMPVDPGNLLLTAKYRKVDVLGLPGCVRSPKRNGFDFVFERLAAGLEVLPEDVMHMGIGGIIPEPPKRPVRRTVVDSSELSGELNVAAIVLAAGQSTRMGEQNKLFLKVGEHSMIQQVVANLADSAVDRVFVVTGHDRERVREELQGASVTFIHNSEYAKGLSTSLRTALAQLPKKITAALICLGDMPFVGSANVNALISAFDLANQQTICVPTFRGKRGNPVLWGRNYFQQIMEIQGDVGAKHIIGEYENCVVEVEMRNIGVLTDFDTPEAYAKFGFKQEKEDSGVALEEPS